MNLNDYLKKRGASVRLARAIGVAPAVVSQWICGIRPIPAERCPAIEAATDGAVTCEDLRPDVPWHLIRQKLRPGDTAQQEAA